MTKKTAIILMCLSICAFLPAAEAEHTDWVVWLSGYDFVQEWSIALEALLTATKPGESILLYMPGKKTRFVRQEGMEQWQELIKTVRATFEANGFRQSQLIKDLGINATALQGHILRGESGGGNADHILREYLNQRKELMALYNETTQNFWNELDSGLLPASSRLLVLIQQHNLADMDRETLEAMRNNPRMNRWTLELQDFSPWEAKGSEIKALAQRLADQKSRVDCLYLRGTNRPSRGNRELSKSFQKGVGILTKKTGGINQNLNKDGDTTAAALLK